MIQNIYIYKEYVHNKECIYVYEEHKIPKNIYIYEDSKHNTEYIHI